MSDDLISMKSLIENLNKFAPEHYNSLVNGLIAKEPTAFNRRRVIDELERLKLHYFLNIANTGDEKLDCAYKHVSNALNAVYEIIQKEGIE